MMGEVGPRWPQEGPRYPQDGPKKASTWSPGYSKMVLSPRRRAYFLKLPCHLLFLFMFRLSSPFVTLKSPKMTPRWPEMASRWPPDGPQTPRVPRRTSAYLGPVLGARWFIALSSAFPLHVSSFLSFRSPEIAQNHSKMARDGLKMAPRWPPDGPQTPRTSAYLGVPRRTWGQFWVQDGPRRA